MKFQNSSTANKELQKQGTLTLSPWIRKFNCNSLKEKFHTEHLDTEIAITGPDQPGSDTYFYHYHWTTLMDDFCAS